MRIPVRICRRRFNFDTVLAIYMQNAKLKANGK